MKIIIDERERDLYEKCVNLISANSSLGYIILEKKVLPLGDIIFEDECANELVIIERKSLKDLLSSVKDGRYEEQSYRLIHSSQIHCHNIIYLIEGILTQLRPDEKKLVHSCITSLCYFKGFSTLRTGSMNETAEMILNMAHKIHKDLKKGKKACYQKCATQPVRPVEVESSELGADVTDMNTNVATIEKTDEPIENYCSVVKKVKKDNITKENIGEIVLSQIPGISSVNAIAIMKNFKSFPHFLEEIQKNPDILNNMTYETNGGKRKISKKVIESIKCYFTKSPEIDSIDISIE
jgi:ERCC4-type nuclease